MKKNGLNLVIAICILFVVVFGIGLLLRYGEVKQVEPVSNNVVYIDNSIDTGVVEEVIPVPTIITVEFPDQPRMPGNYADNTKVLISYIEHNMRTIDIPENISGGYITFKVKNELDTRYITVKTNIYLNGRRIWGRLEHKKSINNDEYGTYIFDLTNLPVKLNAQEIGGNILEQIRGKKLEIGAFVGENNNKVESITVSYFTD